MRLDRGLERKRSIVKSFLGEEFAKTLWVLNLMEVEESSGLEEKAGEILARG